MRTLGFVVNPIAGMGGKVGLKGTDGVLEEAIGLGASPRSPGRAKEAMSRLAEAYTRHRLDEGVHWLTASGGMGAELLTSLNVPAWSIEAIHEPSGDTSALDTRSFVEKAVRRGCELIVFCGGDGTARDLFSSCGGIPIFGIPSGVKMHSGVFAVDPTTAGELMEFYIRGDLVTGNGEIMDLDEARYRTGEWNIALFGIARTLYEPSFVQAGKLMVEEESIENVLSGIAQDIRERLKEGTVLIMGPGGTMSSIGDLLGFEKTLLGVDAVSEDGFVARDCSEQDLIRILDDLNGRGKKSLIAVSPIGGQGFFLGRGNLQLSPDVIVKAGIDNVLVVSTPHKLESTRVLRVDSGDKHLDMDFRSRGVVKVLTGYRSYRLVKIE